MEVVLKQLGFTSAGLGKFSTPNLENPGPVNAPLCLTINKITVLVWRP